MTANRVAFNPQDRFLVTMGNLLMVTTQSGDVWGHEVSGQNIGVPSLLNPPELRLELAANPNNNQIYPDLVITGHGFTPTGHYNCTIHNWPLVPVDIHRSGAADGNGSFRQVVTRDFASVKFGVDVPPVGVTAVDEATGQSVTESVSAERLIARWG